MEYTEKEEIVRENSARIGMLEGSLSDIRRIQRNALGKYLSRGHGNDTHTIEDVCQDALRRYLEVHERYDKPSDNHPAILAGITRIAFFNYLNMNLRHNKIIEKVKKSLLNGKEIPLSKGVHSPEEFLCREEEDEKIKGILEETYHKLSEDQRIIYDMIIEGVPRGEAISRLGLKPNTYDTKLRRLRKIILKELKKD